MTAFAAIRFGFRPQRELDVGIDAHAELIESGLATGRLLGIQLKSGPSCFSEPSDDGFIFREDREHVTYWQDHSLPVLVCLCDVANNVVYWQVISQETAVSTGKRFRFDVPRSQKIDPGSVPKLRDILTPVVAHSRYTIFKESDQSHAGAKRYSFEVVVNGTASKAEIAAIIRQVTSEGATRRYSRNDLVQGRWGDSDADVVWTFVYPSADDHARSNSICRSLWIRDGLPEEFRPLRFPGENVGDGIIVKWNQFYADLAEHAVNDTVTKGRYLSRVPPLVEELRVLLATIKELLVAKKQEEITEGVFLSSSEATRRRISEIDEEVRDMPPAPFECVEMDKVFLRFVASLGNVALVYSERHFQRWNESSRLEISLGATSEAYEELKAFDYEIMKVS